MLTNEKLDAIYGRMADGTATYEDAADLFMNSFTGLSTGVTREQFMVLLTKQFPTPEALAAQMRAYAAQVSVLFASEKARRQ
jgi:hypothetical protein